MGDRDQSAALLFHADSQNLPLTSQISGIDGLDQAGRTGNGVDSGAKVALAHSEIEAAGRGLQIARYLVWWR